jgi:hypothetical protein
VLGASIGCRPAVKMPDKDASSKVPCESEEDASYKVPCESEEVQCKVHVVPSVRVDT